MNRSALAQAIAQMETVRDQTGTLSALREWRVRMAQLIIRPARKARKS